MPTDIPSTDAIFLVLRRMRAPLVLLIGIFAVAAAGLAVIPGQDADGNPAHMSIFDAFYFMSYTATTIGFGELAAAFTIPQRMWVTAAIYSQVIGWAYSIGTLFSLLQDPSFQDAIATGRFRRRVRRLSEPFLIVAGYGQAGRRLCRELDALGRRMVVVDAQDARVEKLAADQLASDVPGIEGDVHNPALLGPAGLGSRHCEGVVTLTNDGDANLAVVMTVNLLRPGPVGVDDPSPGATLDVTLADAAAGAPDTTGAVGLVAGAELDTTNLSIAAHARLANPEIFLSVRQHHHSNAPLLAAFNPDAIFVPNDLVVMEALARIITPVYWSFVDHMLRPDDANTFVKDDDEPLRAGDILVVAARRAGLGILTTTLYYDSAVEYVATGHEVASTWAWRKLGLPTGAAPSYRGSTFRPYTSLRIWAMAA